MREGQRDEDSHDPSTDGGGTTTTEAAEASTASADQSDERGASTAPADQSDERGVSTAPADQSAESETVTATQVVENVAGTTASVPSAEEMETAMAQTGEVVEAAGGSDPAGTPTEEGDSAAGPAGVAGESTAREEETRVLEFALADERYCLDIEYIEEIVKQETITRVPNTPEFVEGVVDLRGQITTILNPKVPIGKADTEAGDLIVVFDAEAFDDQGAIGWVVDDVRQVSPVTDDQVNDPPMGDDYINGVIDREDDEAFVIWTTPDLALEDAD
jgi:purine-binding chemotaxis protein CheW